MKKFRKILLSALSLVLVVALTIVGTVAFLQDEDGEVNVMTVGNVYIEQLEQEWNNGKLQDFTQAKPLYPVPNTGLEDAKGATVVAGFEKYPVINEKNVVDKYVSIENIGKSEAYVRTVFAFEMGDVALDRFLEIFVASRNENDYDWSEGIVIKVGDVNYYCVVATYKTILGARRTTAPSLYQVFLKSIANNKDCMALDGNKNGAFDILTMSQAVQTEGFKDNTATYALNAAFGAITELTHPWTEVAPEFKITVSNEAELDAALANGGVIYLANDIEVEGIKLMVGKDATAVLYLNGYEIKSNMPKSQGAVITNYGTLTIQGGTISSVAANGGSAILNKEGATLNVVNAILNGAPKVGGEWPSYALNNYGTAVISDTEVNSIHGGICSYGAGAVATLNNVTATIAPNGEATGMTSHVLYTYENGKMIVNGGNYTNNAADANAKGGTVVCNYTSAAEIIINGGTFNGLLAEYSTGDLVINAGTFNKNPKKYAGENVIKDNGNGTWTVYPETDTWDGTADTSWYPVGRAVTTEYELYTAEHLAGLAELVNKNGVNFAGCTINLMVNVDLQNKAWTPIGRTLVEGESAAGHHPFDFQFRGNSGNHAAFNGNGKTVSNLNVNVSANAGLFGTAVYAGIYNVNVENATITANRMAGTVLGQGYARVEGCNVKNVVINVTTEKLADGSWDNGDKVGGVVGKISEGGENSPYGAINCSAENVKISAYRDAAGILGYAGDGAKVTGNSVTNITLVQNLEHDYKNFGENNSKSNINPIVGDSTRSKYVVVENNQLNGNTYVESTEDLKDILASGEDVSLGAGSYTFPASSLKEGQTIYCEEGVVFEGGSSLNINGATVVGGTFSNTSGNAVGGTINGTFKNCVFTGKNALRGCYAGETVVFENCVFAGNTYGVHFDGGANEVIFINCTFSGFNAIGAAVTKMTVQGCTFVDGPSAYNGINIGCNAEFKDTKFIFDGSASTEWVHLATYAENKTVSFTNCTVFDGENNKSVGSYVGVFGTNNTVTVDGINISKLVYIDSAEDLVNFANDVNVNCNSYAGKIVMLDADIDLAGIEWIPVGQTGATQFTGTFDGNGHVISNMTVNNTRTNANCSSGLFGWLNGTVKNVVLDKASVTGHHLVGGIVGYVERGTVEGCVVKNSTFNCVSANADANGDKCGAVAGQIGATQGTVVNCSAEKCTVTAGRDAGQVVGAAVGALAANVTGCTATDVTVTANGTSTGANINNTVIGRK